MEKLLKELQINVRPDEHLRNLSVANQQLIEIAKGIFSNPKVLILDEPTAALTSEETVVLFEFLRRIRDRGSSIIYITHRLQEVAEIADCLTILRDGRVIDTKNVEDIDISEIVSMMIGRESKEEFPPRHKCGFDEFVLEVKNLSFSTKLHDVSLTVRKGEIVGLAGLVGCGQQELVNCIVGLQKAYDGQVNLSGKSLPGNIRESVRRGLGFVSENRKLDGLFLASSICFNVSFANLERFSRKGFIDKRREQRVVRETVEKLRLKYTSLDTEACYLSGGNQQKVVMAKWLCCETNLLIINEPTRGIDVGAKYDIYMMINNLAEQGVSIFIISSDFNELAGICERIYIIRDGIITGEVENDDTLSEKQLLIYASKKEADGKRKGQASGKEKNE